MKAGILRQNWIVAALHLVAAGAWEDWTHFSLE
jgi:hypothetical protein